VRNLTPVTVNEDLLHAFDAGAEPVFRIYEPAEVVIVLGAGRRSKPDLVRELVDRDGVPVLLRKGGGGTVVLSPGMVVLTLVTGVASSFRNREYAREINGWIRTALETAGVQGVDHRGISDLALGDRKILGASLFRRRRILFYQSSLLVCNDLSLFDRYLTFPDTVPDYRDGRSHGDFCTSLFEAGYRIAPVELMPPLTRIVRERLPGLSLLSWCEDAPESDPVC